MSKIRFALVGSGWRAKFYIRISKALPEIFELTSVLIRDPQKAEAFGREFNVQTTSDLNDLIRQSPDYVVLSVMRGTFNVYLKKLFQQNVPVLCETPPAETLEDLLDLWKAYNEDRPKIQIAEQYFAQPLYAAWYKAITDNLIGEVENINISALHGYHGANIIRRYLNTGFENCRIYGKRFNFNITETYGRDGMVFDGQIKPYKRDRLTFEFDYGKVAFFDFADVQYHSFIRTRQLNVQGTRGEIDDLTIRYLNGANISVTQSFNRIDQGIYNNQDWAHFGIMLGEKFLYKNPFPGARLNDDEIAVATCMYLMKEYLDNGKEFYSLKEALQDTYLSIKMNEALVSPNREIKTEAQLWSKD